jgi:hypothetical protein
MNKWDMEDSQPLPFFNYHGYLPEGIHETDLASVQERFVTNEIRAKLWRRLQLFLEWAKAAGSFSDAYINGGFITNKTAPEDIDVILQTKASYGPDAFAAMTPFFAEGIDCIYEKYSVHLHFWCEGFPGGMSDFRHFFQYLRPQDAAPFGLKEGAKKGIVKIRL